MHKVHQGLRTQAQYIHTGLLLAVVVFVVCSYLFFFVFIGQRWCEVSSLTFPWCVSCWPYNVCMFITRMMFPNSDSALVSAPSSAVHIKLLIKSICLVMSWVTTSNPYHTLMCYYKVSNCMKFKNIWLNQVHSVTVQFAFCTRVQESQRHCSPFFLFCSFFLHWRFITPSESLHSPIRTLYTTENNFERRSGKWSA